MNRKTDKLVSRYKLMSCQVSIGMWFCRPGKFEGRVGRQVAAEANRQ